MVAVLTGAGEYASLLDVSSVRPRRTASVVGLPTSSKSHSPALYRSTVTADQRDYSKTTRLNDPSGRLPRLLGNCIIPIDQVDFAQRYCTTQYTIDADF